jgi:hypothetical protein
VKWPWRRSRRAHLGPDQIVALLRSPDPEDRKSALAALDAISAGKLPPGAAATFLGAATGKFPDVEPAFRGAAAELVKVLEDHADEVDPEQIARVYSELDSEAKAWALRVLTSSGRETAVTTLATLLQRVDELPTVSWPALIPLEKRLHDAGILVGPLAAALASDAFARHAASALLAYAEAGDLGASADAVAARSTGRAHDAINRAAAGSDEELSEAQASAGLYLDLLGRTGSKLADPVLREAIASQNPWIAMWGAIGLERSGTSVSFQVISRVASNASCRKHLYSSLRELGKLDRFPVEFANQSALAEADMVNWLLYPTELDSAPDEIELLTTVELPEGDDVSDLYVFRYRKHPPHSAAEQGWMIGIAGPYLRSEQPTPDGLGATFSRMESEDSKTLAEHIESNLGTITDWMARRK